MLEFVRGNILESEAEALVNPVNTVGIMGKGLALQFKMAFPENFSAYAKVCAARKLAPGGFFIFQIYDSLGPRYIVNFATKRHWKEKSRLEDVRNGLRALAAEIVARNIQSIAIPPLGCGLGGLDWADVKPIIEAEFGSLPNFKVSVFEP
jgi:O-acetyl-ADP-ribose deacetylase (regulator of RNase III)